MKLCKILVFIFVFFASFFLTEKIANAAMTFSINNNENTFTSLGGKQFSRNRVITIRLNLTSQELANYSDIQICEYISVEAGEQTTYTTTSDKCRKNYNFPSVAYQYQITTYGDGLKHIGVDLLQKNSQSTYTNLRKEIYLDTTGPAINLNGSANIFLLKGSSYDEQGAVSVDQFDLNPQLTVSGSNIVTNKYGLTQYVTYTATDFLGNVNEVKRKIIIEAAPVFKIDTSLAVGIFIAILIMGSIVYINIWQRKERKKQRDIRYREMRYQKKNSVL